MDQRIVTGETSTDPSLIMPQTLWRHLSSLARELGLRGAYESSLAYSTSEQNTGWTGFILGANGHVTLHHWDAASPPILQLDLVKLGASIENPILGAIKDYWSLANAEILSLQRDGVSPIAHSPLAHGPGSYARRPGAGPNRHAHFLVDAEVAWAGEGWGMKETGELFLRRLVPRIDMRPLTDCYSAADDESTFGSIMGVTTSHLSIHAKRTGDTGRVFLDVFSCKDFDPGIVKTAMQEHYGIVQYHAAMYTRYPELLFAASADEETQISRHQK